MRTSSPVPTAAAMGIEMKADVAAGVYPFVPVRLLMKDQFRSDERIGAVFRPKVDAALTLHELTRDMNLSAFVLFSSAAAVLGAQHLGHYAAANEFLNALAHHRRARKLPALTRARNQPKLILASRLVRESALPRASSSSIRPSL